MSSAKDFGRDRLFDCTSLVAVITGGGTGTATSTLAITYDLSLVTFPLKSTREYTRADEDHSRANDYTFLQVSELSRPTGSPTTVQ